MIALNETAERVTRGNREEYWLTPGEVRIIEWLRRGTAGAGGRDWIGMIRYVSGPDMFLLHDTRPAGRVNNE